jgi:hypothetical protein
MLLYLAPGKGEVFGEITIEGQPLRHVRLSSLTDPDAIEQEIVRQVRARLALIRKLRDKTETAAAVAARWTAGESYEHIVESSGNRSPLKLQTVRSQGNRFLASIGVR